MYELKIHGFAWYEMWKLEDAGDDFISLVLSDNKYTRTRYPFSFKVELHYRVTKGRLTCHQAYREAVGTMIRIEFFNPNLNHNRHF